MFAEPVHVLVTHTRQLAAQHTILLQHMFSAVRNDYAAHTLGLDPLLQDLAQRRWVPGRVSRGVPINASLTDTEVEAMAWFILQLQGLHASNNFNPFIHKVVLTFWSIYYVCDNCFIFLARFVLSSIFGIPSNRIIIRVACARRWSRLMSRWPTEAEGPVFAELTLS